MIGQFWLFANHLPSCAQILTNMSSMWNPPTTHLSTFLHLKFCHQKLFFKKWAYLSNGKDGYRLPPSFLLPFSAHSLIYCLLIFFLVRTERKSGTGLGLTSFLVLIVVFFLFTLQHQTGQTGAIGLPVVQLVEEVKGLEHACVTILHHLLVTCTALDYQFRQKGARFAIVQVSLDAL